MIIKAYSDGSVGYNYESGDRVVVKRTIHGGWFNVGPTSVTECDVVYIKGGVLYIRWSPEWGLAECFDYMVEPTTNTILEAAITFIPPVTNRPA